MKLHLPLSILVALSLSQASVYASGKVYDIETGTVTLTYDGTSNQNMLKDADLAAYTHTDGTQHAVTNIVFNTARTGSTTDIYMVNADRTINAAVEIQKLHIDNGYSNRGDTAKTPYTYTFNGTVSGATTAEFKFLKDGVTTQQYTFNGDVSKYYGLIDFAPSSGHLFIFANSDTTAAKSLNASSIEVAGTVKFNGAGAYIVNSTVDSDVLTVENGAVSFTGSRTVGEDTTTTTLTVVTMNVASGSAALSAATTATNINLTGGMLTVAEGNTLTVSGLLSAIGYESGDIVNNGIIDLGSTGVLRLAADYEYVDGNYTIGSATSTLSMGGRDINQVIVGLSGRQNATYANGVISITGGYAVDHTWSSAEGTWSMATGGNISQSDFAAGDSMTFVGAAAVTLGNDVVANGVSMNGEADVVLTGGGHTLQADSLQVGGTLTLKDAALGGDTKVAGAGTLVFDLGDGTTLGGFNKHVQGFTGGMVVKSGCYMFSKNAGNTPDTVDITTVSSITVKETGRLSFWGRSYDGTINILDSTATDYAVNVDGVTLQGSINITGAAILRNNWGATIASSISGVGNLTLQSHQTSFTLSGNIANTGTVTFDSTGGNFVLNSSSTLANSGDVIVKDGTVNLQGNVTNSGKLDIQGGTAVFGEQKTSTNSMAFTNIDVASGATLQLRHGAATMTHCNVNLKGGKIFAEDLAAAAEGTVPALISMGNLTLSAASQIQYRWKGALSFEALKGDGNLEFLKGESNEGDDHRATFKSIDSYTGVVSKKDSDLNLTLAINGANQAKATDAATVNIDTQSENFSMQGKGSVTFGKSLENTGTLTVSGGTLAVAKLSSTGPLTMTGGKLVLSASDTAVASTVSGAAAFGSAVATLADEDELAGQTLEVGANHTLTFSGKVTNYSATTVNMAAGAALDMSAGLDLAGGSYAVVGEGGSYTLGDMTFHVVGEAVTTPLDLSAFGGELFLADNGVTLTLDLTGFSTEAEGAKEHTFNLITSSGLTEEILDNITLTLINPDSSYEVDGGSLSVAGGSLVWLGTITAASIPEPATATLSLLALAGLAARRRRRK